MIDWSINVDSQPLILDPRVSDSMGGYLLKLEWVSRAEGFAFGI